MELLFAASLQILKVELGRLEDPPGACAFRRHEAAALVQTPLRPPGDGAEQVKVGDQGLRRGGVRPDPRGCGVLSEAEDEQRIGEDQLPRRLRPRHIVLIQVPDLARRQAVRDDRVREADTVVAVGARQRDEVLHRGVRADVPLADVRLDGLGERAHQTEPSRHPAHTPIEPPRHDVERQRVLFVQRPQQPRLLEHVLGRVGLQQMAKDQRLARRHLPDHRRHRVAVQPVQAADAFVPVHDDIPCVAGDDDDRHLLSDLGERGQQPPLPRGLPHTERVVAPIQLVKFELHRHAVSGANGLDPAHGSPAAPHATAHRRCSAATTPDGPRPAPQRRVWRREGGEGNPDPSRGGARDTLAAGRDGRAALQDSAGDAGGPPAHTPPGRCRDSSASSRRVRDRSTNRCRRAGRTLDTCAREMPTPRGRNAERASSITGRAFRQNER